VDNKTNDCQQTGHRATPSSSSSSSNGHHYWSRPHLCKLVFRTSKTLKIFTTLNFSHHLKSTNQDRKTKVLNTASETIKSQLWTRSKSTVLANELYLLHPVKQQQMHKDPTKSQIHADGKIPQVTNDQPLQKQKKQWDSDKNCLQTSKRSIKNFKMEESLVA